MALLRTRKAYSSRNGEPAQRSNGHTQRSLGWGNRVHTEHTILKASRMSCFLTSVLLSPTDFLSLEAGSRRVAITIFTYADYLNLVYSRILFPNLRDHVNAYSHLYCHCDGDRLGNSCGELVLAHHFTRRKWLMAGLGSVE